MSETEITFLDTKVYKWVRFDKESILDVQTHYKPTETFQYTNFYSCHPPGVKKGFIKGEALRLLRTNSSQITFERNIRNFHNRLLERGYPAAILRKYLSEVKFANRKTALQQRNKSACKKLLPFVTQYHPALPSLKRILMGKWHLIQNQQRLREIFKEPPLISYRKGKSLKDLLVRAKLWRSYYFRYDLVQESCDASRLFLTIFFDNPEFVWGGLSSFPEITLCKAGVTKTKTLEN